MVSKLLPVHLPINYPSIKSLKFPTRTEHNSIYCPCVWGSQLGATIEKRGQVCCIQEETRFGRLTSITKNWSYDEERMWRKTIFGHNRVAADMEGNGEFYFWENLEDLGIWILHAGKGKCCMWQFINWSGKKNLIYDVSTFISGLWWNTKYELPCSLDMKTKLKNLSIHYWTP